MRELDARDPQQDAVQFQSIRPPPKPYGARPQDEQSSPQGQCEEVHESGGLQLLACSEQCRIYAAVRGIRHVARAPGAAPRETTRAGFGCSLPTTKGDSKESLDQSVRPRSCYASTNHVFFKLFKASSPSPVSRRRVIMVGMPHTTLLILDRHFDDRGCGVSPRLWLCARGVAVTAVLCAALRQLPTQRRELYTDHAQTRLPTRAALRASVGTWHSDEEHRPLVGAAATATSRGLPPTVTITPAWAGARCPSRYCR